MLPDHISTVQILQTELNGQSESIHYYPQIDNKTLIWQLTDNQPLLPNISLQIDFEAQLNIDIPTGKELNNYAVVDQYFSKPSSDIIERRLYPTIFMSTPLSLIVPGLILSPDHVQTSLPGTTVVYVHTLETLTGDSTGTLSFSVDSQENLTWVLYYDSNDNGELDSSDQVWKNGDPITSLTRKIFLRTVLPTNPPVGFQDTTILTGTLIVEGKSFDSKVTDITRIIDQTSGKMNTDKKVAVDSNCDTQLSDESLENQTFESDKSMAPGECAIYRLYFTNQGTGKLYDIRVKDQIPPFTTFIGGTAMFDKVPDGLIPGEIVSPPDGSTGMIIWNFSGELLPGLTGIVSFEIKLDE